MSEMGVKGIVWDKISLNAANIAFIRKLEKFDCAVVMDEQGSDKYGKAQAAVLDTVLEKKKPSILLITTEKLMYGWYQSLLSGIGADFKFITANESSINYFSSKLSNLYIASETSGNNPIFAQIKEAGIVWDLVIIDGGLSKDGINTDLILNSFDIKTKKLVVFAVYIKSVQGEAEKLSRLPEKFLEDRTKAAYFTSNKPDSSILDFSLDTPYGRYYGDEDMTRPNVRTLLYAVNNEILKVKAEQATPPLYCYGGNIFEELTLDMRKLYNYSKYDDETVTGLRNFDAKLGVYLDEISMLLEDPDNRVITYFSSERTLEYVYKVLSSSVIGLKRVTAIKKSRLYNIDDTNKCFEADVSEDIRIVLSLDDQNEQYSQINTITHVINYELPNNPLTLHRRFRQGGRNGFANPQFIVFRDKDDQFDGRMLGRVLALNFCSGYCGGIPGRNVYLYIDGLEGLLADTLCELDGAENFNSNKLSSLSIKYNLRTPQDKVKEILCSKRNAIRRAFGLADGTNGRAAIEGLVREKLEALRKGFCCFDHLGALISLEANPKSSEHYAEISGSIENEPRYQAREEARKTLNSCTASDKLLLELSHIEEAEKGYVCYCTWRFLVENCNYNKNYNAFLKEIFEEVI